MKVYHSAPSGPLYTHRYGTYNTLIGTISKTVCVLYRNLLLPANKLYLEENTSNTGITEIEHCYSL